MRARVMTTMEMMGVMAMESQLHRVNARRRFFRFGFAPFCLGSRRFLGYFPLRLWGVACGQLSSSLAPPHSSSSPWLSASCAVLTRNLFVLMLALTPYPPPRLLTHCPSPHSLTPFPIPHTQALTPSVPLLPHSLALTPSSSHTLPSHYPSHALLRSRCRLRLQNHP